MGHSTIGCFKYQLNDWLFQILVDFANYVDQYQVWQSHISDSQTYSLEQLIRQHQTIVIAGIIQETITDTYL